MIASRIPGSERVCSIEDSLSLDGSEIMGAVVWLSGDIVLFLLVALRRLFRSRYKYSLNAAGVKVIPCSFRMASTRERGAPLCRAFSIESK